MIAVVKTSPFGGANKGANHRAGDGQPYEVDGALLQAASPCAVVTAWDA
jgi:DUF971 family protein